MTATTPDFAQLFKAGAAAYQQGDYAKAQAVFTKLSQCPSRTYRTKAALGLARTYMAQKQWVPAKALCEKLSKSPQPQVQQWSLDALKQIEAQNALSQDSSETSRDGSGFQPLSEEKVLSKDASGFQPIASETTVSSVESVPVQNAQSPLDSVSVKGESQSSSIYRKSRSDWASEPFAKTSVRPDKHNQPANAARDAENVDSGSVTATELNADATEGEANKLPHAGRLARGKALGKMKRSPIWFAQAFSAIALFSLLIKLFQIVASLINSTVDKLYPILPYQLRSIYIYHSVQDVSKWLVPWLFVLLLASPWLWDLWLRFTADRQPFSIPKLRLVSPEAAGLISTRCQQKRWTVPTLWKLPTDIPLIFSYGWLPRNARLVVSEGLLSQLAPDEISALVSYEMSHWKTFYWPLLSLQHLLLQLVHKLYWFLAFWGNRQTKPLGYAAGVLATVSYVAFWLLRIPGIWISRVRTYFGDRAAAEYTGNPNGLARALTKLSFGLANSVTTLGYTPAKVESLALLLPVATDLVRQPMYGTVPLEQLFAWDSKNPLRSWMSIGDSHPPLGDRLRVIMAYARHWKLDLEISLDAPPRRKVPLSRSEWTTLIAQGLPFFGVAFGTSVGLFLWLLGSLGEYFKWPVTDWMYKDTDLLWACILMGLGIGTLLRINRFFPDLSFNQPLSESLTPWSTDPQLLPNSSLPAKLSGTLLGRPGLANWLGQDLLLKTSEAQFIRLHFFSVLGPLGNIISLDAKVPMQIGKSVQVLGWFRRGNHPWLDIDKLRLSSGTPIQAAHPIFSLVVAIAAMSRALWLMGFNQIFQEIVDKIS